ncbi:hypothetical protein EV184_102468 [Sinorhizobium americanum]|uniref:Uncharacterized protein n=1 Tax=Sinorhizobium americanum TaxID=194963 RepID=A0A4R2C1S6_9HYPH|nr:hypothetical protein EV184_102468 [Sinorhizobium americanum]
MLAIAFVTLAGFGFVFRIAAGIGSERSRDVVALLEPAFLVAADIAFVSPSIDQFALAHDETPLKLFLQENARGPKKMHRIRTLGETRKTSTRPQLSY